MKLAGRYGKYVTGTVADERVEDATGSYDCCVHGTEGAYV
jgi:hypothetical protein